jgi:hypothetical protein
VGEGCWSFGAGGGAQVVIWRTYLFWTTYGRQIRYILVGTLLGWNTNLALFYNLYVTEVNINRNVCYSLAELYVKSVYLNLFWWMGGLKFMTYFMGGPSYKRLGISELEPFQNSEVRSSDVEAKLAPVSVGPWWIKADKHGNHTILLWQLNPYLCNNGFHS